MGGVMWCGVMFYLEKIEMAWRGLDEVLSLGFLWIIFIIGLISLIIMLQFLGEEGGVVVVVVVVGRSASTEALEGILCDREKYNGIQFEICKK